MNPKIWKIQHEEFQIYRLLGKGEFGEVYRARWMNHRSSDIAIKRIDKEKMLEKEMFSRVNAEVRAHESLDHRNILKLYKVLQDEHYFYLILELCGGGDLEKFKKQQGGKLTERDASWILRQVIEGLKYLQSKNILHRDLKLANVLLTEDNVVKIADFGLVTEANRNHRTICGTPLYMAPEVASGGPQGFKVDVWSLGCFFYTLIVGSPPFQGKDAEEIIFKATFEELDIPHSVSQEARSLIVALLQKDPAKRISLDEILYQPFFGKRSMKGLYDSGVGSSDSGLSNSFGRRSDLRFSSLSNPSLPTLSEYDPPSHYSYDTGDDHYLTRPRIGRSADVKSENCKNRVKSLRSQVPTLPSHGFNPDCNEEYPFIPPEDSDRQEWQLARRDSGYEHDNDYNHLPGNRHEDHRVRNHLPQACCCTSETALSSGGHCDSDRCSRNHNRERARSCSPARHCQGGSWEKKHTNSNFNASNCSHFGTCDTNHCCHEDSCRCRKLPSPAKNTPRPLQQNPPKTTEDKPPPLDTSRLKYVRLIGRSAAMTVLERGDVICEILKTSKDRVKVVDVYCISGDGMTITFYRPANQGSFSTNLDEPPLLLEKNFKKSFSYNELPKKYWNRYKYSANFVAGYKAQTPKVVIYSPLAKCVLMESGKDFTVAFYNGPQIVKSPDKTEITTPDGNVIKIRPDFDVCDLREDMIDLWKHFIKMEKNCRSIESSLQSCLNWELDQGEETDNDISKMFFPAYLGRRPPSVGGSRNGVAMSTLQSVNNPPNLLSYNGSKMSSFNCSSVGSFASSMELQKENLHPTYQPRRTALKPSNQIQRRVKNHQTETTHEFSERLRHVHQIGYHSSQNGEC